MRPVLSEIPFYGLYGEPLGTSNPGLVHIEEIEDRSRGKNWLIKPHRHSKLFQLLFIEDGQMELTLGDLPKQELTGSWILSIPAGVAHGFQFQPDSKGFVLSIDNVLLNSEQENFQELLIAPQLIQCFPDSFYFQQLLHFIELLKSEFKSLHAKRHTALEYLSKLVLLNLERQFHQNRINHEMADTDSQTLKNFLALLESNYRAHWSIADYADQLHISISTLGRLCQKYIGRNPKLILQDRLLMDAKRQLLYTQKTAEEIAYVLGFKDSAYFARFFKLHTKMAPGTYRKGAE